MVYSTTRFVLCLTLCYFVLVFSSPFSIVITSIEKERANLSAFRTFDRFALVWFCLFPLPLGVWEGLRFVIMALLGLFSYLFVQSFISGYGVYVDKLVIEPVTKNIYFSGVSALGTPGASFLAVVSPAGDFVPIVTGLNAPRDIVLHPEKRYVSTLKKNF